MDQRPLGQVTRYSTQDVMMELERLSQYLEMLKAVSFMDWSKDEVRAYERWRTHHVDQQTLLPGDIEGQVRASIMFKTPTELQQDYVQLKMAQLVNQQTFPAELEKEKETNRLLMLEIQRLTASRLQEKNMYEQEINALRQRMLHMVPRGNKPSQPEEQPRIIHGTGLIEDTLQNAQIPQQDPSSEETEAEKENHVSPVEKESSLDVDHTGKQEVAGNDCQDPVTPQTPSNSRLEIL